VRKVPNFIEYVRARGHNRDCPGCVENYKPIEAYRRLLAERARAAETRRLNAAFDAAPEPTIDLKWKGQSNANR